MKVLATFVACVLLAGSVFGCRTKEAVSGAKPLSGSAAAQETYIPKDLNDALQHLDSLLGDKGRAAVLASTEGDMIQYHMSVGQWIRNNWGLWGGSRLAKYFNQLGIYHPDDMSGIILDSYWRKVHGRDLDLEAQVRHYQDYWKRNHVAQ